MTESGVGSQLQPVVREGLSEGVAFDPGLNGELGKSVQAEEKHVQRPWGRTVPGVCEEQ